jgi:nicotinic acid phosphoribosyltransferase
MGFFKILQIVRAVLAIGPPPDVNNESAFRAWCGTVVDMLIELAALTDTLLDDQVVAKLRTILSVDAYWQVLYTLIKAAMEYVRPDDEELLVGSPDVQSVADEVKINPLVIITIIKTIVDIYNWWKNRRS